MPIDDTGFYTYQFGALGQTLDDARRTPFFDWFHLEETKRLVDPPGEAVRFRPSGDAFRDRCHLDVRHAPDGRMARIDLVIDRTFVDGADHLFAQDLVKSFLLAALPDACRHLLADFLREITTPGGGGATPGMQVFLGHRDSWDTLTGWSHVVMKNLALPEGRVLVLQTSPNPAAPNAVKLS